jgi:putative thioredoxin
MAKMNAEVKVNDKDFSVKVLGQSSKIPVVVDFYADWCGPCQALGPVLEKLAHEYNGKFILAKANVDNCPKLSEKYGVMSIPAVKLFKNGKVASEFTGMIPESKIKDWLNSQLQDE